MKLKRVEIEGYRSIKGKLEMHCDPRVTVVLGANDHGKTNLLEALQHLNSDNPFDRERDLNWDCENRSDELPCTTFDFLLNELEQQSIFRIHSQFHRSKAAEEAVIAEREKLDEIQQQESSASVLAEQSSNNLVAAEAEINLKSEAADNDPSNPTAAADVDAAKKIFDEATEQRNNAEVAYDTVRNNLAEATRSWLSAVALDLQAKYASDNGIPNSEVLSLAIAAFDKVEALTIACEKEVSEKTKSLEKANGEEDKAEIQAAKRDLNIARRKFKEANAHKKKLLVESSRTEELRKFIESNSDVPLAVYPVPAPPEIKISDTISLCRKGIDGELELLCDEEKPPEFLQEFLKNNLPRVIIIRPAEQVTDSISQNEIEQQQHAFMRGIFYYAGIERKDWDQIFHQDDVTSRQLTEASEKLNETLRNSWSQGQGIQFLLAHDSAKSKIDLKLKDPSVASRYARASRRSTGFTHFFALKTILHAQEHEANASSYIWIFDEPGLHLHPSGQQDLMQVIETLAQQNQILYSTHSLFMVNKNYPVRHRLIVKDENKGTRIDGKPYSGKWRAAIDNLGWSLPGTVLFASKVVLVEGDSDPVFLNAMVQKLIQLGRLEVDTNSLAIISTGESKHADALVRMLKESAVPPEIVAIFDGDDGGRQRGKEIEKLLKKYEIKIKTLDNGTTIEDYLLQPQPHFVDAVTNYVAKLAEKPTGTFDKKLSDSYAEEFKGVKANETHGLGRWSREQGKEVGGLDGEPSSLGVAREYVAILDETMEVLPEGPEDYERAENLIKWIAEELELPHQILSQERIVD